LEKKPKSFGDFAIDFWGITMELLLDPEDELRNKYYICQSSTPGGRANPPQMNWEIAGTWLDT